MSEFDQVTAINTIMNMINHAHNDGKNGKDLDSDAIFDILEHLFERNTHHRPLISCEIEQRARIEVIIAKAEKSWGKDKSMLSFYGPYACDTPESFAWQAAYMLHSRYNGRNTPIWLRRFKSWLVCKIYD